MRKLVTLFLLSFLFFTCDDGDVITVEFEFDDTFEACGNLVFHKEKDDPSESFSILLTSDSNYNSLEDVLAYTLSTDSVYATPATPIKEFTINGSSNRFNYRTYNADLPNNYFCSDVPPSEIEILTDEESVTGLVTITTSLIEDDNDGLPAWFEDENLDGDNDPSTNPTDTDGDGIPDYLDDDDDGDNVRTVTENPNFDAALGVLVDPQDTDGDGTPDYLDDDDDGDEVLTRDEENDSPDQNPANDVTNPASGLPDYLNGDVMTTVPATAWRTHTILQEFTVKVEIEGFQLPNVNYFNTYDFGTLEATETNDSRTLTPIFP